MHTAIHTLSFEPVRYCCHHQARENFNWLFEEDYILYRETKAKKGLVGLSHLKFNFKPNQDFHQYVLVQGNFKSSETIILAIFCHREIFSVWTRHIYITYWFYLSLFGVYWSDVSLVRCYFYTTYPWAMVCTRLSLTAQDASVAASNEKCLTVSLWSKGNQHHSYSTITPKTIRYLYTFWRQRNTGAASL